MVTNRQIPQLVDEPRSVMQQHEGLAVSGDTRVTVVGQPVPRDTPTLIPVSDIVTQV